MHDFKSDVQVTCICLCKLKNEMPWCVCVCVCMNTCMCMHMCVCMCGLLHCMNEVATLWNLTLFIYKFYTQLIVIFCLFVNALYKWNVTKTNSCVHFNVTGK